jgi:hypothetical protein
VERVTKEHLADVALNLSQPSQQYFSPCIKERTIQMMEKDEARVTYN